MPVFIVLMAVLIALGGSGLIAFGYQQKKRQIANKISDKDIMELARQNNGELSKGFLVANTELTASEAGIKIQEFLNNGILRYTFNSNLKVTYKLDTNLMSGKLPSSSKKIANKLEPSTGHSDSDIITLAVKQKGKLSAAALCMKAKISVEQAEEKLKVLQEKGIFDIQVNENGTILYVLNDLGLLEN